MGRGMYALPSRPSKFVNARIGPPKTLSNLETRDTDRQRTAVMSAQKPLINGNRARLNNNIRQNSPSPQQQFSPQHEEMVKYLRDTWMRVNYDMERFQRDQREGGPQLYKEKQPNPRLNEFRALNLEQFLADRLYLQTLSSC